jgi:chromosome segregation ATPase
MDAPTYTAPIPPSAPIADVASAGFATDAPGIDVGDPRVINDLVLQNREMKRIMWIKKNAFPLPAPSRVTSAEIAESDLRAHKIRNELILAEEEYVPPWEKRLMTRIETIVERAAQETNMRLMALEGTTQALQVAVRDTNTRLTAVEGTTQALQDTTQALQVAVRDTNTRLRAVEGTIQALEVTVRDTNTRLMAVEDTTKALQVAAREAKTLLNTLENMIKDMTNLQQMMIDSLTHQTGTMNRIDARQTMQELGIHNFLNRPPAL